MNSLQCFLISSNVPLNSHEIAMKSLPMTDRIFRIYLPFAITTLILSIIMIFSSSVLNWDEGYYLNTALGFVLDGTSYVRMWELPSDTALINGGGQGFGFYIYLLLHKIFGMNIFVGRIFSLVTAALTIYATFIYVKKILNYEAALLAAFFYSTSLIFVLFINARFDAPSILVGFLILIVAENIRSKTTLIPHLLFGAATVLSLEFHLQNSAFIFAIWIGYLYKFWISTPNNKKSGFLKLLSFSLGTITLAISYVILHYYREFAVLTSITENCAMCDLKFFAKEVIRIKDLFTRYPVESVIIFFSLFYFTAKAILAEEKSKEYSSSLKMRILMFLGGYLFFIVIFPPHREFFLWPIFAPIIGFTLYSIFYESKNKFLKAGVFFVLIIVWLRASAVAFDRIILNDEVTIDKNVAACIKDKYPIDTKVLAPGPKFIYLSKFINFLELGRGIKYAIPLSSDLRMLSEEDAAYKMILKADPAILWIDTTDWPESQWIAHKYLRDHFDKYEKCCLGKIYCRK